MTVVSWLSGTRALWVLFTIYIGFRASILLIPVAPSSDAAWYLGAATRIAEGFGYSETNVPTAYWPPGWPGTLAVIFRIFGSSLVAVQLFNLFCATWTAYLTYILGRRIFRSELAARFGLLLLAVYPNNAAYVSLALTEVFFTLLLILGCLLLVWPRTLWSVSAAGFVFGVATLVKAQSLIFLLAILMYQWIRDRTNRKTIIREGVVIIAIAFLTIIPWSLRNYIVFGEFVLVSTNGGLTLLTGNNASANGDYTPNDPLVTSLDRDVKKQIHVDREAKRRAFSWIKDNPASFIKLIPRKIWRLWAPDGESEWGFQEGYQRYTQKVLTFRTVRGLNQAYYIVLMVMFSLAAYCLLRYSNGLSSPSYWWGLPYIIALVTTGISIIFSGQSRYHYPVMPFITMTCGWFAARCVWYSASRPRIRSGEAA